MVKRYFESSEKHRIWTHKKMEESGLVPPPQNSCQLREDLSITTFDLQETDHNLLWPGLSADETQQIDLSGHKFWTYCHAQDAHTATGCWSNFEKK